jgi:zinc protease
VPLRFVPRLIAAALVALGLAWPPLPAAAGVFHPETFTLDNGLEVVVIANPRVPVVSHMLWYKVGSADEPAGRSGIAHFLEHLMFKGTQTVEAGAFSRTISRLGGRENAFTSYDFTAYFQNVAKDQLGRMMELEADRMANLVITEPEVEAEREVVLEERRSRTDNDPASQFGEQTRAASFLAYPYRIPVIGWENEIRRLGRDDAEAFYRTWYAPNNAVLVVAGDVDADEVRRLAERTYGVIPARPVPDRVALRGEEPPQLAARRLEMRSPRVDQPNWSRRWQAPGNVWGDTRLAAPLQVLAEILGGDSTSRLYRRLVVETGVAVAAGAGYGPSGLGPQTFVIYASPRDGTDLVALEAAVETELTRVLSDGVTDAEVASAITRMTRRAVFARDDVLAPARLFGDALASGGSVADVEEWPERIAAVTAAGVAEAAAAVFVEERSVTAVLRPVATD